MEQESKGKESKEAWMDRLEKKIVEIMKILEELQSNNPPAPQKQTPSDSLHNFTLGK